jgi:uncharacterized membrane protein
MKLRVRSLILSLSATATLSLTAGLSFANNNYMTIELNPGFPNYISNINKLNNLDPYYFPLFPLNKSPGDEFFIISNTTNSILGTTRDDAALDRILDQIDPPYGTIQPLTNSPGANVLAFGAGVASEAVAAGWSDRGGNLSPHAISWTLSGGTVDLGSLGTGDFDYSFGYDISDYADVIVGSTGSANTTFQAPTTAFRFTTADNMMRDLGSLTPANPVSVAYAVNSDGSVAVGSANIGSIKFPTTHAFRWVQTPGQQTGTMTDIDNDPLSFSEAYAVNGDGSVVVGKQSENNQAAQTVPFVWTQATGMVKLVRLPGYNAAIARSVSRDGTIVVGTMDPNQIFNPFTNGTPQPQNHAFRWTQATGLQDLNTLLPASGVDLGGSTVMTADAVSRDGQYISGVAMDAQGNMTGYVAQYCAIGFCASPLVAAVLPASRSVQVGGTPATAFATIINNSTQSLTGCSIVAASPRIPISFTYQTTDSATNKVTGSANTPVSLSPGAAQSFVISFTPSGAFSPTNEALAFNCTGQLAAVPQLGLNTLLLSASTTPVPDIVALAASGDPGIVDIPGANGAGAFAVATVDVGAGATITATANTGSATLPVSIALCQTDPTSGSCISPIGPSVTTTIAANATPTFGIFVGGSGTVPFDPANNRIFVQFADQSGVIRGSTSVAVRTQ